MKLRNKKTGEVGEAYWSTFRENGTDLCISLHKNGAYVEVRSLAELNDEWEDYAPAEPLIKDKKIRKAVRAWWKTVPDVVTDKRILYKKNQDLAVGIYSIYCGTIIPELDVGRMYTIAELCGEEEE